MLSEFPVFPILLSKDLVPDGQGHFYGTTPEGSSFGTVYQQLAGLVPFPLLLPQATQTHGSPQLQRFRSLSLSGL